MNVSKHLALSGSAAVILLSGCVYDNYGTNGYGNTYQQGYGQQAPNGYGQQPAQGGYAQTPQAPQGGYAQTPPAGYGAESGDVVTYPGDTGGAPAYGGNTGGTYTPPATTPSAGGRTYSVQKGDSLYRIGKKYGVSMQEIIRSNGLSNTTIHPGQELIIP